MKELKYFAKNPFNPNESLSVDVLIQFIKYNEFGIANLGEGVQVKREEDKFYIYEEGEKIQKMKDKVDILVESNITDEYIKYGLFPGEEEI